MRKHTAKKRPAKKLKVQRPSYSMTDQNRSLNVAVNPAEIIALSQAHLRIANGLPNRFAKWLAENRKATDRDVKGMRTYMIELIDTHLKREKELVAMLPDETAPESLKG